MPPLQSDERNESENEFLMTELLTLCCPRASV